MLQSLNTLAGKISPNSPTQGGQHPTTDNNANKLHHLNNNTHPYSKSSPNNTDKSMNMNNDQPDPDFIKMFVGQIPHTMDENDLTKMFSEFGRVHQINVLRDKITGRSKGCCFVTFFTRKAALEAQNALHNIKTLPGMHHPIQMKPADSENRNERKLFVGMLAKRCTELDVRGMFETFGHIEECTVLRDANGQSKGCAFVTYMTRQCALNAIKAMHHSITMEGCTSSLVVKFADTPKEKDQKRYQQLQSDLWAGLNALPSYVTMGQPIGTDSQSYITASQLQLLSQLQNGSQNSLGTQLLLQNSALPNLSALNSSTASLGEINPANLQGLASLANFPAINPINMQNLVTLAAITAANSPTGSSTSSLSSPAHSSLTGSATAAAALLGKATTPATGSTTLNALNSPLNGLTSAALSVPDAYSHFTNNSAKHYHQKQPQGPDGANLFIYHLPADFDDTMLAKTFTPFGNVISAKVYIDKETNMTKCFGFVSYDNILSAQLAIQNLNGYHVGGKKLKVEIKRKKGQSISKPY
ncbi:CUGBP Elav-like family member 1 isoform X3 [Macrosteles quadrilineatus]|uniref:CUGBP Elav-like family member 1 isoform X3 n=1 Tax=Macrosteles quadrilineatus TaxID=74068 RepID=UPI0023E1DC1F|nr:CUGBP Elav-like family member 1 isoform X3 [Macrosteles quadrilineatus]XP_054265073.1 CUGBP Elav-like family member 1 isoform X3 [Macrosteles quadrilineatus]